MTVGSHVAEIVRQGIWASLTGGWYYEPGCTLFCNAVHLYLWLILFLIPLLLGLSFGTITSMYITVAYVTFITLLFVVLKFTVSYLHNLFDTVDPTPYPPARSLKVESFSCETTQHSNEKHRDEEIEMVDLRKKDGDEAEDINHSLSRNSLGRRRCVRIGDNSVSSIDAELRICKEVGGEWDEDRSSGRQTRQGLIAPSIATLLPVDSLELLPTGIRHHQSDNGTIQCIRIDRKFSEPCLKEAHRWNRTRRRRLSDTGPCVRRAKSAFETSNKDVASGSMLNEQTLEECKRVIRKSYPTKMSSTAAFLSTTLTKRSCPSRERNFDSKLKTGSSDICYSNKKNLVLFDEGNEQQIPARIDVLDIISTSEETENLTVETIVHLEPDSEPKPNVISSGEGWRPIFVSLGDLEKPSTSTLHRTSERLNGGGNFRRVDLKGEITKFLEELIDKHPETLDAIESVRMNRLGRGLSSVNPCLRSHPPTLAQPRTIERSSTTVAALSNLAMKDGTHVALDHEDTSQGAVHSFQDEDGNWWTYVFDEHGVGTAHALGSSRALMEMIQSNSTATNAKLAVLPGSDSDSTEDSDIDPTVVASINEGCSHTQFLEGASLSAADRCRALSSSSTESSTYIADTPSAIYHASSSALMSRHPNRDRQMVSFSMMAARLRNATRRRSHGSLVRGNNFLEEQAAERMPQVTHLMSTSDHQRALNGASRASPRTGSPRALRRMPFFSDISGIGTSDSGRINTGKKSHYYRIKLFPSLTGGKGIKLEMDRLSVAALFDRNSTLFSTLFDICLASVVALLTAIVLSRSIYYDLTLILFAFVVAGTHFSLLKSVQPDAASPIHGFNWLVTYSRPIYFSVMAVALLLISGDWWNYGDAIHSLDWEWNFYRVQDVSLISFLLACRDLLAVLLILLPIAFTFGLLPQVNTLVIHLLEQVEMNVFGGTASFSLLSGLIQISKSLMAFGFLCFIAKAAKHTDPNGTQNAFFSAFTATAVAISYFLSRSTSNPGLMALYFRYMISSSKCSQLDANQETESETKDEVTPCLKDPLPDELQSVIINRIKNDVVISLIILVLFFAIHCTSIFTAAQPFLQTITCIICIVFGFTNHYLYMELRKNTPWRIFARPILRAHEFAQFESLVAAKLTYFEIIHFYMLAIERNVLYPLFVVSSITINKWTLHPYFIALFALRILRSAFSQPQLIFLPLAFSFLLTKADLAKYSDIDRYFPLLFYLATLVWPKLLEFSLKINFILAYVAPWQISWGSAFHAFAQPFSVPHTALSCIQTMLSSIISAPLNPFLGSSFFLTSYVRPVKFWEKDYNTRRVDHSNTRLISQIDRGPMMDDSNLNAVFYEHLTRSLQSSLAGDILLGRWCTAIQPGDCFILASYYLNCLVHIIEVGNGFVTFQLRGLEFRGTYCHQREVEAISEDVGEGVGCCCCSLGPLPGMLSLNTAWVLRWLAWEVVTAKYIIDGYSITDNSAVNLLQVHELRRLLVTLYVKSIIFYALNSPKFSQWIRLPNILCALSPIETNIRYVDLDPMFSAANDEDFDINLMGVSRQSFTELYENWILHCVEQHSADLNVEKTINNRINAFCFALSVVGRRALAAAAHNRHANAAESFLYGLHALFKGDFRITCQRDEWVFTDMDLLRCVVAPAIRMALKLHQDHFTAGDDFDDAVLLYERITHHLTRLFISHEHDPAWRRAIIANTPTLLALRHIYDDGQDDYKIIMLNKMHLNMRVIKLNRECVRAFWAGQQQELIFLRNRNPERGSIQNARQVLRNMINSSADQPIGYPIYVSPLTTSFVDSHSQVRSLSIPPRTFEFISRSFRFLWTSLRMNFGTSGSSNIPTQLITATAAAVVTHTNLSNDSQTSVEHQSEIPIFTSTSIRTVENNRRRYATASLTTVLRQENSIVSVAGDGATKVTLCKDSLKSLEANDVIHKGGGVSLASTRHEQLQYAKITNIKEVFTCLDQPLKSTGEPPVTWPHICWQTLGGRSSWDWMPLKGHRGKVVHKWVPFHPQREQRSHAGTIYLLCVKEMGGCYVPVGENGIESITKEEYESEVKVEVAVKMEILKA